MHRTKKRLLAVTLVAFVSAIALTNVLQARILKEYNVPIEFESINFEMARWVGGEDLITWFESSPGNHRGFCSRCGSQVPNPSKAAETSFEIPAGALDDDPRIVSDKHIYVEFKAPWDHIADDLPQMTKEDIQASRRVP